MIRKVSGILKRDREAQTDLTGVTQCRKTRSDRGLSTPTRLLCTLDLGTPLFQALLELSWERAGSLEEAREGPTGQ